MKFKVYTCTFSTGGVIEFNPVTGLVADRLVMFAEYLTPQGTGCVWEIKSGTGNFEPLENYKDKSFNTSITTFQLRAILSGSSDLSPVLAVDTLNVVGFMTGTSGSYVSRNVTLSQSYTIVTQIYEAHIPNGCTVTPQFAVDTSGTAWVTPTSVTTSTVDGYYTRYTYTYTLGASATNFRARLNITSGSAVDRPKARKFMNIMK